jgi:hypothetical protein
VQWRKKKATIQNPCFHGTYIVGITVEEKQTLQINIIHSMFVGKRFYKNQAENEEKKLYLCVGREGYCNFT